MCHHPQSTQERWNHRGTLKSRRFFEPSKSVNDTFGHVVGDSVLRYVAKILVAQCRMSDFIFRYGGEEFLVLLTETAEEQAIQIAERIREAIERDSVLVVNGNNIHTTASFGIATFDGHPDYRHLIEDADRALYLAKAAGRNRWHVSKKRSVHSDEFVD
ncbi:GGDEF domain-containing protein [Gluconobacter japonicus]|uniref:GGDEF domain-containing protein n=1 Tax=Gluconobacter japonicus TaxID=376620 RepID=UPI003D27EF11